MRGFSYEEGQRLNIKDFVLLFADAVGNRFREADGKVFSLPDLRIQFAPKNPNDVRYPAICYIPDSSPIPSFSPPFSPDILTPMVAGRAGCPSYPQRIESEFGDGNVGGGQGDLGGLGRGYKRIGFHGVFISCEADRKSFVIGI